MPSTCSVAMCGGGKEQGPRPFLLDRFDHDQRMEGLHQRLDIVNARRRGGQCGHAHWGLYTACSVTQNAVLYGRQWKRGAWFPAGEIDAGSYPMDSSPPMRGPPPSPIPASHQTSQGEHAQARFLCGGPMTRILIYSAGDHGKTR